MEFYVHNDYDSPPIHFVDMQWVQSDETRTETLEGFPSYDGSGTGLANTTIYLQPVNSFATYLANNDFVQIRISEDDGVSYSTWGSSASFTQKQAQEKIILEIQAQNPNYSGIRGYSVFRFYHEAQNYGYQGAAPWDLPVWNAFMWDGDSLVLKESNIENPNCVRIFFMDEDMQTIYENAGLIFP